MPEFEVNGSVEFCLVVTANDMQEAEDMAIVKMTESEGTVEATIDWTEQVSACSGCRHCQGEEAVETES